MSTSSQPAASMQALVLAEHGRMEVREVARPVPAPGEVLLEVLFTGICGSDLHGFTGENGRRFPDQIMGHESVATLAAVGSGVSLPGIAIGDLVTFIPTISCGDCARCRSGRGHICSGRRVIGVDPTISSSFGQFLCVPAANVVALPEGMPAEHGALVEPLAVGYHAVRRAEIAAGDRVLIIGAGPIGQAAALAATREGASRVVVSEPSASRRALIASLGFETIDPLAGDDATGDALTHTADAVIDAVGSSATLRTALQATVAGGNIVLVGMQAPDVQIAAYAVSTEERSILGSFCYTDEEFRDTARWAGEAGSLIAPLISEVVPLERGPEAFRKLADDPSVASKVLVALQK